MAGWETCRTLPGKKIVDQATCEFTQAVRIRRGIAADLRKLAQDYRHEDEQVERKSPSLGPSNVQRDQEEANAPIFES